MRRAGDQRQLSGPVDAILLDGNHNYLREPAAPAAAPDPLAAPLFEVAAEAVAPADPEPAVHVRIKADMTCAAVAGASVLADAVLETAGVTQ